MAETRTKELQRRESPIEPDPKPQPPQQDEQIEPRISAILIAHRQAPALRRAIEALEKSVGRDRLEIIAVDCGSQDDTSYLDVEYEGITMLRLPHHFGATKALNIAVRTAKAEIMFFLSPNVEVRPETATKLADRLDENEDTSAVGPMLVDPQGNVVSKIRSIPTPQALSGNESSIDPQAESLATEYLPIDALMIRKQFIKGMNYFDERFGNSWADADLAMKVLQAQREIRIYPGVSATWHDAPDPLAGDSLYEVDRELGAAAFFGKYNGFMAGLTYRLGAIFRALGRFQFGKLASLVSGQKLDGSQAM